jgi:arylsulfatase
MTADIGRTREESTPSWPAAARAPRGAPNIVVVCMDDMGYSDLGCFGSEIETPHIDALAARGLRFNHYTTHPLCSPARAALLTGMNAHAVGSGWLANNHAGYPGYSGEIPLDAPTLAETLRAAGYETIMAGKWHNTPALECTPSGPKRNWPASRGFDTFYGFMEGETHFFFPTNLMLGNQLVPLDAYPPGYYATDDWTDRSIGFLKALRASSADKPFFLYLAHNAVHAPLQAKAADLAKYRGRYDAGWTALREARLRRQLEMGVVPPGTRLPPPDPRVPDWAATDPADRPLFARHMEAYAAMLDCVDQGMGRLAACLEATGELGRTIIVFTSDNGGTDAGGPAGMFNNNRRYMGLAPQPIARERALAHDLGSPRSASLYPTGWGQVSNTPFPSFKTYTGAGGRRVSFIISWPQRIGERGAIRSQFVHVTDVMPTLLELAGVPPLREVNGRSAREMHGRSFAQALFDRGAPAPRSEQYYECWSNRAYYRAGWLARSLQKRGEPIDLGNWTLHHLEEDFSESVDVAARHPATLAELVEAFDRAAWQYFVYPLDNRDRLEKFADLPPHARAAYDAPRTFLPGTPTVHRVDLFPLISDRAYRVRVSFAWRKGDEGVLWAIGDPTGGMVMYVEGGQAHFHYNGFGDTTDLPPFALEEGEQTITLEYEAQGNRTGRGRLLAGDAVKVDWTDLSPTMVFYGVFEGLDVGIDRRGPVLWQLYERRGTFPYGGTVHEVRIEPGARA